MTAIRSCWRSYFSPWWMKLLAVTVCVVGILALTFVEQKRSWEPGWPRPALLRHWDVNEFSDRARDGVSIKDVKGLSFEDQFEFDFPAKEAKALTYVRIDSTVLRQVRLAGVGRSTADHMLRDSGHAAALLKRVLEVPTVDTIEFAGVLPVETLEPLRGSTQVTRLITSDLIISASDASGQADQEIGLLVDLVRSMPNLGTWAPPITAWYLIASPQAEVLQSHPNLSEILAPDDRFAPPSTSMFQNLRNRLPALHVNSGFINTQRLFTALGVLCAAVMASNLIVAVMAEMLLVSSASMLPRYAETHRLAALALLTGLVLLGFLTLAKVGTALLPAVLIPVLGVLIPGAVLAYDSRRQVPGHLLLPMSIVPSAAILLPFNVRSHGQYWMWLEEFLAGGELTTVTLSIMTLCAAAALLGWHAVPRYTSSLASVGRSTAMVASQREMLRSLGRLSDRGDSKAVPIRGAIAISPELREDRLSSPSSSIGLRDLIDQGMMRVPLRQMLIGVIVFGVLFPIFMRASSTQMTQASQWLPCVMVGAMIMVVLWARPLIFWNERATRVPIEIGMLVPRKRFVSATKAQLAKQFLLPAVVSAVGLAVFVVFRTGSWLGIPVALAMAALLYVAAVWLVLLFITIGSSIVRFIVVFLCGYAIAGAAAATFATMVSRSARPGSGGELWILLPLAITIAVTATLRYFARRRVLNFEFGRLM